jgi:hypothetical protein
MDTIPTLDRKGRFSIAKVKQEVKKIESQKETNPRFSFVWIILGIAITMLGLLAYASVASAAVFDNTNQTTPNNSSCQTGYNSVGGYYECDFTFSSSTLQLELMDVSFLGANASFETTTTQRLTVTTDQGSWTSTSSAGGYSTFTTTTWSFPYPRPWATPGSDWHFNLSLDYTTTTSYQYFWVGTSTSDTHIPNNDQKRELLSDFSLLPVVPQMVINSGGLGGLTIFTVPPNADDFGLYGTSSAMTQDLGFFGNMFRDVMIWLFQPDEAIKGYYNAQKDTLLTQKVPFAYFAAASSTLGGVSTTTDGAELIAGATTTFGYFEFINTADIRANPLMDVLDMIKFWFSIALWASFLFYVYYLIRDFKP